MELRQIKTFVTLKISAAAFREIESKLRAAGYGHAFVEDGLIDMRGIVIAPEAVKLPAKEEKSDFDGNEEELQLCIEVIRSERMASVALLQRRLRLGYANACRYMDEIERRGFVGPSRGSEPREILFE
jgi:DNA segregation ATPase FtsK/SpoIIIE-like protein